MSRKFVSMAIMAAAGLGVMPLAGQVGGPPPLKGQVTAAAKGPAFDGHYILPDEYFVAAEPLGQSAWITVTLAKLLEPVSAASKGQARFLSVVDGAELLTSTYWQTRVATGADLKLGQLVVAADLAEGDIYRAPTSRDEALGKWWMARITDLSQLAAGFVTVSGPYKVRTDALRVPSATAELGVVNGVPEKFIFDAEAGELRFGNGVRGARPPLGARLVEYDSGDGAKGNVNRGAIRTKQGAAAATSPPAGGPAGQLTVQVAVSDVQPGESGPGAWVAAITVSAHDARTGKDVSGRVSIPGAPPAGTGDHLSLTATGPLIGHTASGDQAIYGAPSFPRGVVTAPGYQDAPFTIELKPLALEVAVADVQPLGASSGEWTASVIVTAHEPVPAAGAAAAPAKPQRAREVRARVVIDGTDRGWTGDRVSVTGRARQIGTSAAGLPIFGAPIFPRGTVTLRGYRDTPFTIEPPRRVQPTQKRKAP